MCCLVLCGFAAVLLLHKQELMALKPWVNVVLASAPLATQEEVGAYDAWVNAVPDAHIREWRSQPGNYHLMTKQGEEEVFLQ
jgi:hypothetical protein